LEAAEIFIQAGHHRFHSSGDLAATGKTAVGFETGLAEAKNGGFKSFGEQIAAEAEPE
jgi:hypothetical protein